MDIRKHLFTEEMLKQWNRLSREMVSVPTLTMFKRYLEKALSNMLLLGQP